MTHSQLARGEAASHVVAVIGEFEAAGVIKLSVAPLLAPRRKRARLLP
jgi:hypothetical protein